MSPEFRGKGRTRRVRDQYRTGGRGSVLADAVERSAIGAQGQAVWQDGAERREMIAEEQFDRPKSYRKIEALIRGLIEKNQNEGERWRRLKQNYEEITELVFKVCFLLPDTGYIYNGDLCVRRSSRSL